MCLATSRDVSSILSIGLSEHVGHKVRYVVDCTSGNPEHSKEIAERLKKFGICYMDAPVSGVSSERNSNASQRTWHSNNMFRYKYRAQVVLKVERCVLWLVVTVMKRLEMYFQL